MNDESVVLAARINARHTVIVALITAVTTLLAAYLVHRGGDISNSGRGSDRTVAAALTSSATSTRQTSTDIANRADVEPAALVHQQLQAALAREHKHNEEIGELKKALRTANERVVDVRGSSNSESELRSLIESLRVENTTLRRDLSRSRDDTTNEINSLRSTNESLRLDNNKLRTDAADVTTSTPFVAHRKHNLTLVVCIDVAHEVMTSLNATDVRRVDDVVVARHSGTPVAIQCTKDAVFLSSTGTSRASSYIKVIILESQFGKYSAGR